MKVRKILLELFLYIFFVTLFILLLHFANRVEDQGELVIRDISQSYFTELVEIDSFDILSEGIGMIIRDKNGNVVTDPELNYNGEEIELFSTVVNSTTERIKLGFIVFAGQDPQYIKIDSRENEGFIYLFELDRYSYLNIPITFNPQLVKSNKNYPLYFVIIQDIDLNTFDVPILSSYLTSAFYDIRLTSDSKIDLSLTRTTVVEPTNLRGDLVPQNKIRMGFGLEEFKDDYYYNDIVYNMSRDSLYFEAYGPPGRYSTIIVVEHDILKLKDSYSFTWEIGSGQMIQSVFNLDKKFNPGKYQLYSISFPLDEFPVNPFPSESQRFILEIK